MTTDLQWALAEFDPKNKRLRDYRRHCDYYDGKQPLAFATSKYRSQFWRLFRGFSDNMCQSVVDVQAERLEVVGFSSSAATVDEIEIDGPAEEQSAPPPVTQPDGSVTQGAAPPPKPTKIKVSVVKDPIGESSWEEWEDDSLDLVADLIHTDVFKYGDAFVIADENGVWRQNPSQMAVQYHQEQPGVILRAAKFWQDVDTGKFRLNVYSLAGEPGSPATLTKWESRKASEGSNMPKLTAKDFVQIDGGGDLSQGIPVMHFANKAYGSYGISELVNVLPLQDALNKAQMDLIISMEYQSFRQRWIAGTDVEIDEETGQPKNFPGQHGPGNFLAFPDPETKVGEFSMADLTPYVKVIENLRGQIARVSGIPLHYFFVGEGAGATQSGESLKVGESRFTRKGRRQQRCLGKSWELLMDLVLEIASGIEDGIEYDPNVDINIIWDDLEPRSDSEELDALIKKNAIGVPFSQLQKELGYDPDEVENFAVQYREDIELGVQAPPSKNPQGQQPVAHGESTASTQSGVSAISGTTAGDG